MDDDTEDLEEQPQLQTQTEVQLEWSSQFAVAPLHRSLVGDKIVLPQAALEQLLAAAPTTIQHGPADTRSNFDPFNPYSYAAERNARALAATSQQQLPHPLTFRLVNPDNGRAVYAGIKEFSAEEDQIILSPFLEHILGLDIGPDTSGENIKTSGHALPRITVHAKQLPKGIFVKLRPLEAGYDPEDWKSLLEEHMRKNYTTLTKGELLTVPAGRDEFRFLIDEFKPDVDGVCVVDTDLEVDIEALNEEQARETLTKIAAKRSRAPGTEQGSSSGGPLDLFRVQAGQVLPGEYVDYEVPSWDRASGLEIEVNPTAPGELCVFASPFGPRQRARPRINEHVSAAFEFPPGKRLKLLPAKDDLEGADAVWVSVHVPEVAEEEHPTPRTFTIRAILPERKTSSTDVKDNVLPSSDEVQCKNCKQIVPKQSLILHENFCYRNNVLCPKGCNRVFKKNSDEFSNHTHCPFDETCDPKTVYFDSPTAHDRHVAVFHAVTSCPSCDTELFNTPLLAQHRTGLCPGKLILCRFCHLEVPQDSRAGVEGEVLLTGLTPHELADGARTTECHLCARITRLRDMDAHLRHHDLERRRRPAPRLCRNALCGRTRDGTAPAGDTRPAATAARDAASNNDVGLCAACFGPLYVSMHDPEGRALRRRVERRYLGQLLSGCGKAWCRNAQFCKTARGAAVATKDALPLVKPFVDGLAGGATPLHFCVDERSQQARVLAEMMAAEGARPGEKRYALEWCVGALEAEGNDVGRAREWLRNFAVAEGEEM